MLAAARYLHADAVAVYGARSYVILINDQLDLMVRNFLADHLLGLVDDAADLFVSIPTGHGARMFNAPREA